MNLTITGHSIEITPAIRALTEQKFAKVVLHFPAITSIVVVFTVEKSNQRAEATVHVPNHQVFAHADHADLYAALDLVVDKVKAQLTKHKGKDTGH